MLIKLLPKDVSAYWDFLQEGIRKSLPPIVTEQPETMNNILGSLMSGGLTCFVYQDGEDIPGFVITQVLEDELLQQRNLLIFALYVHDRVSKDVWFDSLDYLKHYIKGINCSAIIGYSTQSGVVSIAKKLGADCSNTFIRFEVKDENI